MMQLLYNHNLKLNSEDYKLERLMLTCLPSIVVLEDLEVAKRRQ
jgi:hypothetical protein